MRAFIGGEIAAIAPDAKISFHTGADAAAFSLNIFNPGKTFLLGTVRGEILEMLLLGAGAQGYATIPIGSRTVLRTLKTHAGFSDAEARSYFALAASAGGQREPLEAAQRHFVEEFAGTAQMLLQRAPAEGIFVIAEEPAGEWFARALGNDDSLAALFPNGGVVRALKPQHFAAYVAAHKPQSDIFLLLEALFIDSAFWYILKIMQDMRPSDRSIRNIPVPANHRRAVEPAHNSVRRGFHQ